MPVLKPFTSNWRMRWKYAIAHAQMRIGKVVFATLHILWLAFALTACRAGKLLAAILRNRPPEHMRRSVARTERCHRRRFRPAPSDTIGSIDKVA